MKFQDFASAFKTGAGVVSALVPKEGEDGASPFASMFASATAPITEKVEAMQEKLEEKAAAVESAAVKYAAATLALQAIAAFSAMAIAIRLWKRSK